MFDRLAADIVSFGGNVDKVVGDGIVALFGAPVSHGDDAERAVRAALKMQDTVRRFQREVDVPVRMRIGVNTGEALVGSLRADTDYTATGDAVNTASGGAPCHARPIAMGTAAISQRPVMVGTRAKGGIRR